MPDNARIVCVRCSDLPEPKPDSTTTECSICGAKVWIAPTTIAFMAEEPNLKVACNECFMVITRTAMHATEEPEPVIFTAVPGAHVDLEAFVARWMGGTIG